ncbi:hypothetical protein Tco_0083547 [Tanacetum coccineum]
MQGTSLTKQERECKLYDEFDKFTYKKGETLHEFYLEAVITHNAAYQAEDLDAYDSDCDNSNSSRLFSWPIISRNGSNALTESNDVSQTKTDITSDSNIIPYSQYLSEAQQETVQNSNSSAQQDVLILSMFDQLSTQVTHCTTVNKALNTELKIQRRVVPNELPYSKYGEYSFVKKAGKHHLTALIRFFGLEPLKNELRKLKGKAIDNKDTVTHSADPNVSKDNMEPITPKLLNKRTAHSSYIRIPRRSFGVRLSTSASGSQPSGNTKNDRILQTPSSNSKNKVEAHPRNVKSSLNKKNGAVNVKGSAVVQNLKKQDNSDSICVNSNDCMPSDNLCVSNAVNVVKSRAKPKKNKSKKDIWKPTGKVFTQIGYIWRPTGRTFTIVGNACPLTRITTTNEVPSRKPIVLDSESPKPVVKLVYSRKPRKNKNAESVSKTKVLKPMSANKQEPSKSWGSTKTNIPSTSLNECRLSKSSSVKFGNDQVAKIMGYGDYQIGNATILRVYYVEGLGHNLFSVGQFCDSNLEVAFRQHTCFIRNLEGVDLLTGSRGDNLYTLSLGNMMASSPICLLSKASKISA